MCLAFWSLYIIGGGGGGGGGVFSIPPALMWTEICDSVSPLLFVYLSNYIAACLPHFHMHTVRKINSLMVLVTMLCLKN